MARAGERDHGLASLRAVRSSRAARYQKARSIVKQAQSNDNISAHTHDLMQRILAKEIHHVRALADTGTLIPKVSSGYKLFPTPKQATRLDHFCEYLYKLLSKLHTERYQRSTTQDTRQT